MMNSYDHEEIEFALYLLHHPQALNEEKAHAWLEVEENRMLLEELRCFREAGMLASGQGGPNTELQWRYFSGKMISPKRNIRMIRLVRAVVAVVVIFIVSGVFVKIYKNKVESEIFTMAESRDEVFRVKLITEGGKELLIDSDEVAGKEILHGKEIIVDSLDGRKYLQIRGEGDAKSTEICTLQVPRGGEYMVILDDGTRVWLNSESEIRYPISFGDNKREVYLKGEAYFEVTRDTSRPFVVETSGLKTKVLGTEFNIQAYPSCVTNVTLVKGCVLVKRSEPNVMDEVMLNPGENVSLVGKELRVEKVDILKYVAWKDDYFYYDNVCLEDILQQLGRWFDFTVFYQNPETKSFRFKFWANRKDTTEEVLQRLNDTGRVRAELKGKTVVLFNVE